VVVKSRVACLLSPLIKRSDRFLSINKAISKVNEKYKRAIELMGVGRLNIDVR